MAGHKPKTVPMKVREFFTEKICKKIFTYYETPLSNECVILCQSIYLKRWGKYLLNTINWQPTEF